MKVFVAGGSGFVGREVISQLLAAGHTPYCLVRKGSQAKISDSVTFVEGDILQPDSYTAALSSMDAIIYLIGIIAEDRWQKITYRKLHYLGAKYLIDATKEAGVHRFLHMSALGSRPNANAQYHQSKYQAEEYLKSSGLCYTIFRPSLIFGPQDASINLFAQMIRASPVVPVIGSGQNRFQPVYVGDVAAAFTKALTADKSANKTYELGGPEQFSNDQLLAAIATVLGKKSYLLHTATALIKPLAWLGNYIPGAPLTSDQLIMLQEDNVTADNRCYDDLGITPQKLGETIAKYL